MAAIAADMRRVGSWDETSAGAKKAHVNNKQSKNDSYWGFLNLVGLAICILSCSIIVYTIPKVTGEVVDQLWLYWQPLAPITFMIWLWGYNVHQFENLGVPYDICFSNRDRRFLLPADDVLKTALFFTSLVLSTAGGFCYCCLQGWHTAAQSMPVIAYMLVLMVLLLPVNMLNVNSRLFFASTLRRVLIPLQEVTWSDFLLADVLTSLSKCTSDIAKATCGLAAGGPLIHMPHENAIHCSPLGAHVLLALCLPYIIRFVQCIIVNRTTGNTSQIFNAIKYASAFPALVLSAIEHEYHVAGRDYPYRSMWLAAMAINTTYSCYWDIEMDWDMPWLAQPGAVKLGPLRLPAVKSDSMYALPWYVWAVISNIVLRLTWTHRLLGNLENYSVVALTIAMLEAYRRYQWVYIRVETEIRKIKSRNVHEHVDKDEGM